jgi:hypothetical protein
MPLSVAEGKRSYYNITLPRLTFISSPYQESIPQPNFQLKPHCLILRFFITVGIFCGSESENRQISLKLFVRAYFGTFSVSSLQGDVINFLYTSPCTDSVKSPFKSNVKG